MTAVLAVLVAVAMFEPVTLCRRLDIFGMGSPSSTPLDTALCICLRFHLMSLAMSILGLGRYAPLSDSSTFTVLASCRENAVDMPMDFSIWNAAKFAFSAATSGSLPARTFSAFSFAFDMPSAIWPTTALYRFPVSILELRQLAYSRLPRSPDSTRASFSASAFENLDRYSSRALMASRSASS